MQHVAVSLVAEDGQALRRGVAHHLALVTEQGDKDGLQLGKAPEG